MVEKLFLFFERSYTLIKTNTAKILYNIFINMLFRKFCKISRSLLRKKKKQTKKQRNRVERRPALILTAPRKLVLTSQQAG